LLKELERKIQEYDIDDSEKICQECKIPLTRIGDETSEQLEIIPARAIVKKHVRLKYACKCCQNVVRLAPVPKLPIPKSIAAPSLLAHVLVSKYKDHLPLYRQEGILNRAGVDIPRRTLSSWVIKSGKLLLPLAQLMQKNINGYDIAYADETRLQVLNEPGRKATSKSYMWLFGGGAPNKHCWIYKYSPSRSSDVPLEFFSGDATYLHCDGYSGYDALSNKVPVTQIGCWAHCRRKFIEADKVSKKAGLASWWIEKTQELFRLESHATERCWDSKEIALMRKTQSAMILNEMRAWIDKNKSKCLPGSALGKAIYYADNQWDKLTNYCLDGRLEISNNRTERNIRPMAIGRKNWLFSQSVEGADASAVIYSLIITCEEHNICAHDYLATVLTLLPKVTTDEELENLLPYNIDPLSLKLWY